MKVAITLFSVLVSTDFIILSLEPFKSHGKVERIHERVTFISVQAKKSVHCYQIAQVDVLFYVSELGWMLCSCRW